MGPTTRAQAPPTRPRPLRPPRPRPLRPFPPRSPSRGRPPPRLGGRDRLVSCRLGSPGPPPAGAGRSRVSRPPPRPVRRRPRVAPGPVAPVQHAGGEGPEGPEAVRGSVRLRPPLGRLGVEGAPAVGLGPDGPRRGAPASGGAGLGHSGRGGLGCGGKSGARARRGAARASGVGRAHGCEAAREPACRTQTL